MTEMKNICGKIPVELHEKVRAEIEEKETSTQIFIRQVIEEHFNRLEGKGERLYHVMQETRHKVEEEKAELQSLVSDISHQTKIPIANLKMLNDTMLCIPRRMGWRYQFY